MDISLAQAQQTIADAARRCAQQKLQPAYRVRDTAGCIES